jgi:hypothetical protein
MAVLPFPTPLKPSVITIHYRRCKREGSPLPPHSFLAGQISEVRLTWTGDFLRVPTVYHYLSNVGNDVLVMMQVKVK